VDACGLNCPGPIMKLTREVRNTKGGDMIEITATDNGFERDIAKWTNKKGFKIVKLENNASKITAVIQKL
jgi:TusA-related sulfurtransferase